MWAWINGPGAALKYPVHGATNYLGAYDRDGNLIRVAQARGNDVEQEETLNSDENEQSEDGEKKRKEGNQDDNVKAESKKNELPPESAEDLRPFPLNPFFRSEPVLSEELRTEIYRLHLQEEKTVREISIIHSVEMSRVAAVIRLKTVEQDWIRQVRA